MAAIGNFLICAGFAVTAAGIAVRFAPWLFSWFGHLPGDIRYESESSFVFMPIGSMLVISVVLSVVGVVWQSLGR